MPQDMIRKMICIKESYGNLIINKKFYFEVFNDNKDKSKESDAIKEFYHKIKPGYIPTFFGPRTDIKFISHIISKNEEKDKRSGDDTVTERLILEKPGF